MKRYFLPSFALILLVYGFFFARDVLSGSYPASRLFFGGVFLLVVAGLVAGKYAIQRNRLDQTIEKHEFEDTFE